MATIAVVKECLLALSDRTGSSLPAINKWIESEKKVSVSKVLTEFYSVLPDDAIFELLGSHTDSRLQWWEGHGSHPKF